ncbi:MAG: HNH endonuclease [Firmicutes bacterium]|nr:HNH endonuclease [Bacillota bacterium]
MNEKAIYNIKNKNGQIALLLLQTIQEGGGSEPCAVTRKRMVEKGYFLETDENTQRYERKETDGTTRKADKKWYVGLDGLSTPFKVNGLREKGTPKKFWTLTERAELERILLIDQLKEVPYSSDFYFTREFYDYVTGSNLPDPIYPDEVLDDSVKHKEGKQRQVTINIYERDQKSREECIRHYGAKCTVCGIDFGKAYGPEFKGMIHVHHLKMISGTDGEYEINPIDDLRPVCPNCHMVLHKRKNDPYKPEHIEQELRFEYNYKEQ